MRSNGIFGPFAGQQMTYVPAQLEVVADITRAKNLNPPRCDRTYPWVVKRARHNSYRVKRPGDHGTRHDGPATIKLVNLRSLSLAS